MNNKMGITKVKENDKTGLLRMLFMKMQTVLGPLLREVLQTRPSTAMKKRKDEKGRERGREGMLRVSSC